MALLPPAEVRRLRAKIGGHALAASADPMEYTLAARQTFHDSFRDKARAEAQGRGEQISNQELERRGEAARRAHYARLALRSVQARSRARKKTATAQASVAISPADTGGASGNATAAG